MIFGESASVGDISNGNIIIVYPNPAKDSITFEGCPNKAYVELYDGFGKQVLSQELPASKMIYVGHLAKGVYVYKIVQVDEIFSGKIVVE